MTEDTNHLRAAVDALTQARTTKTVQSNDAGITCTSPVTHPPLLDQLDDAIRGTIGIGGSGALASERNMLNNDALAKSLQITSQIRSWARSVRIEVRLDATPRDLLRAWFVLFAQAPDHTTQEDFYISLLGKWKAQIASMFDPPRTRDLPAPCPECGASTWWDSGQEYPRPLLITFHDGPNMIDEGKGVCRACEATFGLRELSYAIDDAAREPA